MKGFIIQINSYKTLFLSFYSHLINLSTKNCVAKKPKNIFKEIEFCNYFSKKILMFSEIHPIWNIERINGQKLFNRLKEEEEESLVECTDCKIKLKILDYFDVTNLIKHLSSSTHSESNYKEKFQLLIKQNCGNFENGGFLKRI